MLTTRKLVGALIVVTTVLVLVVVTAQGAQPAAAANGCACHPDKESAVAGSLHAGVGCIFCHEGAAAHAADSASETLRPAVPFAMEFCGQCHPNQFATNTYTDAVSTRFAGSAPGVAKTSLFEHYNDIVDGHPFVLEYNEDRTHSLALEEHIKTKRGKAEVCVQCKSTKVAYYWDGGERTIHETHTVVGGHSATAYTIPAGTKIDMKTDWNGPFPNTYEVKTVVTLPDNTKYSSYTLAGATKNLNWTWAATIALNDDGLEPDSPTRDSGTACNHCHDPHAVARNTSDQLIGWRIIRKAELDAIAEKGLNPYDPESPTTFDGSLPLDDVDRENAICGQCHVEYVCGGSRIDGIDRDWFPWAKASDLDSVTAATFPGYGAYSTYRYIQDWTHGSGGFSSTIPTNGVTYLSPHAMSASGTPVPLIKSQHPETEANWNSDHYFEGAGCAHCHMPRVQKDGEVFTSHYFASPYKYNNPSVVASLADATGIDVPLAGVVDPCSGCHTDVDERIALSEDAQDQFYSAAKSVESLLVGAMAAIQEATQMKASGGSVDATALSQAVGAYQKAHAVWENLAVSENSMGVHDPDGELHDMAAAGENARIAADRARYAALALRPPGGDAPVERASGLTRYETALALSQATFVDASCDDLVLASGADYPDAISASGLAGAVRSPVLLTQPSTLATAVLAEVDRLSTSDDSRTTVWIIGGEGAVGPAVATALSTAGYRVERLAGLTRYETAAAVARAAVDRMGPEYAGDVFLASGQDFPDALACSPIAWSSGIPVLLTPTAGLSPAASAAIDDIDAQRVIVLGGTGAVSAAALTAADTRPSVDATVRWYGVNRYLTAIAIANNAISGGLASADYVGIATGATFPDALAGGPVAGSYSGVMLLTTPTSLQPDTAAWLGSHQIQRVDVYGGTGAVSESTRSQIDAAVN